MIANPTILLDGVEYGGFSGPFLSSGSSGGGGGSFVSAPVAPPSRQFDTSPIAGLRDDQKYRGNLVSDIKSALESYRLNASVGRGGQYAQDVVKKYGAADIRAGAASYLQAAGLTFLADAVAPSTPTPPTIPTPPVTPSDPAPTTPAPETPRSPFEQLLDVLPQLFGGAVYNPPLQSQAYGYTPVDSASLPGAESSGGGGLVTVLILGAVAVAAYFIYRKVKGSA